LYYYLAYKAFTLNSFIYYILTDFASFLLKGDISLLLILLIRLVSQKITLDILEYSVTPYHIDYQSVTKTILVLPGPPVSPGFDLYTPDFQPIT